MRIKKSIDKRFFFLAILLLIGYTSSYALSTGGIVNGIHVDQFPDVSFVFHSNVPNPLDRSDFWYLKESGRNVDFKLEQMPVHSVETEQSTIVLWEDMAYNGYEQFYFTQNVLSGFFSRIQFQNSDKFAVYAFNRIDNTTPSALIPITDGFANDRVYLANAVKEYVHSQITYKDFPNRSDLYSAIRESFELLSKRKGVKSVIVFTAGYSMKNSGAESESQVLMKAQQLHIPVYIYQYYKKSGVATESKGFAQSTFGSFKSYLDAKEAERDLLNQYPKIKDRYNGYDYKFSFCSELKRGGETSTILLSVDGVEFTEQLVSPPHTVFSWLMEHKLLIVFAMFVIILLIVAIYMYVRRTSQTIAKSKADIDQLENQRISDKESFEQSQKELEDRIRKENEDEKRNADLERLEQIMHKKNLYPRLRISTCNDSGMYEIIKPITHIGRESDNDLVLSSFRVSRHHAQIEFNGVGFEITDLNSTNKVIVNGEAVERAVLRSGDLIKLGDVNLTFSC